MWGPMAKHQAVVEAYRARGPKEAEVMMHLENLFKLDEEGNFEDPSKTTSVVGRIRLHRDQLLGAFTQQEGGHFDFDGRPGWSPEVRLGRWIIAHKEAAKGSKPQFNSYQDKSSYDKALAELNAKKAQVGPDRKSLIEYLKVADKTDRRDDVAG